MTYVSLQADRHVAVGIIWNRLLQWLVYVKLHGMAPSVL